MIYVIICIIAVLLILGIDRLLWWKARLRYRGWWRGWLN
jgi:hypothetical protein